MKTYVIFGLVGQAKAGKTTLLKEVLKAIPGLQIIKSVTTRQKRSDEEDEMFYDFLPREEFERRKERGDYAECVEHAGNGYGYDRNHINNVLSNAHGICVIDEYGVLQLQREYPVKAIKIVPNGGNDLREEFYTKHPERRTHDAERDKIHIPLAGYLINSFAPGGKEEATQAMVLLIETIAKAKKG